MASGNDINDNDNSTEKKTVLVVDDEPDVLTYLSLILENLG